MKLPDETKDYLLAAAESSESVDAMESFSNGLEGHYHYIKYVVIKKDPFWSYSTPSFDVAIALHTEQWNFGLEDGEQRGNIVLSSLKEIVLFQTKRSLLKLSKSKVCSKRRKIKTFHN